MEKKFAVSSAHRIFEQIRNLFVSHVKSRLHVLNSASAEPIFLGECPPVFGNDMLHLRDDGFCAGESEVVVFRCF